MRASQQQRIVALDYKERWDDFEGKKTSRMAFLDPPLSPTLSRSNGTPSLNCSFGV